MFELSTVGAKVAYCVATTAGTRPTTGYVDLVGITEAPEIDLSTETLSMMKKDLMSKLQSCLLVNTNFRIRPIS